MNFGIFRRNPAAPLPAKPTIKEYEMESSKRDCVPMKAIDDVVETIVSAVNYNVKREGPVTMASNQEVIGCLRDAIVRFESAMCLGSLQEEREQRLIKIAVVAILGLVSLRNNKLKNF